MRDVPSRRSVGQDRSRSRAPCRHRRVGRRHRRVGPVIKYLGSKRRLVPVLSQICAASGARTALDLFTGTTRVAQAFKAQGLAVTAARHRSLRPRLRPDLHRHRCCHRRHEGADRSHRPPQRPARPTRLRARHVLLGGPVLPTVQRRSDRCRPRRHRVGVCGVTLVPPPPHQPDRGGRPGRLDHRRPDGLREAVGTALGQAARRCGCPSSCPDGGRAVLGDALELAPTLGPFDLAYVDPPYNQHRYFTNYHVWETLVAWDAPEPYGVARKRIDARDPATRSAFNSKRTMPDALRRVVRDRRLPSCWCCRTTTRPGSASTSLRPCVESASVRRRGR